MDNDFKGGFEKQAAIFTMPKITKVIRRVKKFAPTKFPRTVHSKVVKDMAKSFKGKEHKIDAFRNRYGNENLKMVLKKLKNKREYAAKLKQAPKERVWDAGKHKREYLEKMKKERATQFHKKMF